MGKYAIYERDDWTTLAPNFSNLVLPVPEVYAHHTVTPFMGHYDAQMMRNLEAGEIARGGYIAVAYHTVIAGNGDQVQGRPAHKKGGATLNKNDTSVAIALPGNYMNDKPTMFQIDSFTDLLVIWRLFGILHPDFVVRSHHEVFPTACCGINYKPFVPNYRHQFDVKWAALTAAPSPAPTPVPTPAPIDWHALWKWRCGVIISALKAQQGTGTYGYNPTRSFSKVKVWQEACNLAKLQPNLDHDGYFGAATRLVTTNFQKFFRLAADGIVGDRTRKVMIDVLTINLSKAP